MIGRQRKLILALLGAVVLMCAGSLSFAWVRRRVTDLAARTAQYESRLSQMARDRPAGRGNDNLTSRTASEKLSALERQIDLERAHFYEAGELSVAEFSSQIQRTLTSAGLTIRRYRPIDLEGMQRDATLVEFVVEGRASSLLAFLAEVSHSPKYRRIPGMTIHRLARAGFVDATFRIGYETIEVDGSQ